MFDAETRKRNEDAVRAMHEKALKEPRYDPGKGVYAYLDMKEAEHRAEKMDSDVFKNEYLQTPFLDPEWDEYLQLAREYHTRCDAYDDMVCTAKSTIPGSSESVPANEWERRAINMNARDVRDDIEYQASCRGLLDCKKLQQAIVHVARGPR